MISPPVDVPPPKVIEVRANSNSPGLDIAYYYLARRADITMMLSVYAARHKMLWEVCGYEISEISVLFYEVSFLSFYHFSPSSPIGLCLF